MFIYHYLLKSQFGKDWIHHLVCPKIGIFGDPCNFCCDEKLLNENNKSTTVLFITDVEIKNCS